MKIQSDIYVNPVITILSWLGLMSLMTVCWNEGAILFYISLSILGILMANSIIFKLLWARSLSYDFVIYHFVTSLSVTLATFLSTLKIVLFYKVSSVFHILPIHFNFDKHISMHNAHPI